MQGSVLVRASHRLVESGENIVVLVPVTVISHIAALSEDFQGILGDSNFTV